MWHFINRTKIRQLLEVLKVNGKIVSSLINESCLSYCIMLHARGLRNKIDLPFFSVCMSLRQGGSLHIPDCFGTYFVTKDGC